MRSLEGLARALREVPDASTSEASWRALVGDAFPLISGCLTPSKELSQGWPCGAPGGGSWGCTRTLVEHGRTHIEAVCEGRSCPTEKVERGDAVRQTLDLVKLALALTPALHVHEKPRGEKPARLLNLEAASVLIGALRLDERVAVALTVAHGPTRLASVGAAAKLAAEAKRALVIAPVEGAATADLLAATGVDVVSLDEVIEWVDGRPRARLSRYIRAHHAPGLDPSPWFHEDYDMVVDPINGCAWSGVRRVEFGRNSILARTFCVLARRGGEWVDRLDLIDAVWGEEADNAPLSKRKSDLQKLLDDAGWSMKIETERSDDSEDGAGAYRLPVASTRVDWWSTEPAWAPPKPQRKSGGTPNRRKSARKS
jgi:hypothetical protein